MNFRFIERNVRRTPFQALAAVMVMFFTFAVLLIFLLIAAGSQKILLYYESKPQVIAFFKDGTSALDVIAIQEALEKEPRVTQIKYVSKEDALKIYKDRNKNDPMLLELVTANILPSSLEISATSPKDLAPIAEVLRKEPVVEDVIVPEDVVQTLTSATKIIRAIGVSLVSFLILFSTLVILMVIGFKIRLKRQEIEIMRLVGASPTFIRSPFIMEGIFYGVLGAFFSWVVVYILLWYFTPFIQNYLGEVSLLPINPLFMLMLLCIQLLAGMLVGSLGSFGAVKRYLRI